MADKLQQGIAVLTTFADGETPTAAKLSSITAQLRNAVSQLERAVGDIHDQSYPYSTSTSARLAPAYGRTALATVVSGAATRSLDIANIARLIGPASNLNPEVLDGTRTVTEDVPTNVHEFALKYPPASTASVVFSANGVSDAFYNEVSVPTDLNIAGDYYLTDDGKVFIVSATDNIDGGTVQYSINPDNWHGGSNYLGARFNVIPDPNQMASTGCSVGALDSNGRRPVTAPTVTAAQFNDDLDSGTLGASDANYLQQLRLPLILTENYSVGEVIPSGFIVLKNWTTGEVYDDAEYLYNGETSVLVGAVNITTEVDRGDKFCLITVGTDITTSIDDLRRKMGHTHNRAFGEPFVDVGGISGWTAGPWDGTKGSFTASGIEGNYAPQYLHRYGYDAGDAGWNDANALRGDLVIGKSGAGAGSYVSIVGTSHRAYFGSTSGPSVHQQDGTLLVSAPQSVTLTAVAGSLAATAATSLTVTAAGGDLWLNASGGDVDVSGGMHFLAGVTNTYVAGSNLDNAGVFMDNLSGHIDASHSAVGAHAILAGPIDATINGSDNLGLWAIDENGSTTAASVGTGAEHFGTTQSTGAFAGVSAWKVPAIQIIHYAQTNRSFAAHDSAGNPGCDWGDTTYWQANFQLPDYLFDQYNNSLGGHVVLACHVMVKAGAASVSDRWWTQGGSARFGVGATDQGERVIAYIDADTSVKANNQVQIIIAADGSTDQNFHRSKFQGIDPDGDTADDIAVDVKIVLIVAAGSAGVLVPDIVP